MLNNLIRDSAPFSGVYNWNCLAVQIATVTRGGIWLHRITDINII